MGLAETAVLAVELKLGTTGSFAGATNQLRGVEQAAAAGTARTGALSSGFGKAAGAARGFGGAMSHAKGQLGGLLSGPLGLIGVSAGLFTFGGALEQGIHKAQDFGGEVLKMSKLTGLSIESTSALASAFDHYNISADSALRLTGFLEKNIGLLASRSGGLAKFQKSFGLQILDTNGHIKDANELILTTADYFNNKSIPATTKAAAIAKLYGRSWQEMIPLLSAGRQGIIDAEQAAKDFGLTLTKDNIDALRKMKAATRDWGDALGGLELQIGLQLIPVLTDLAKAATSFVSQNRTKIVGFFKDMIQAGKDLGGVIQHDVVPVFKAIAGAWMGLPKEVRDLVIAGFVGNKIIKWTFGFSPITFAKDALFKGLGGFFERGSPANPMWVASAAGGLPGGPGGGGIGGIVKGALPLIIPIAAGVAAGVAVANSQTGASNPQAINDAVKSGALGFNGRVFTQGNAYSRANSPDARAAAATEALQASAAMDARRVEAAENRNTITVASAGAKIAQKLDALHIAFRSDLHSLIAATKNNDIQKFAKRIAHEIQHGVGSATGTKGVLADLKLKLSETHDPKTAAILRHAIAQVQAKLPNREFVQAQLTEAKRIAASTESTKKKLADLATIQTTLKAHGDTNAAHVVAGLRTAATKIDAAKAKATADTNSEKVGITNAIKSQKLAVTIPITNVVSVSNRDIIKTQTTFRKAGGFIAT